MFRGPDHKKDKVSLEATSGLLICRVLQLALELKSADPRNLPHVEFLLIFPSALTGSTHLATGCFVAALAYGDLLGSGLGNWSNGGSFRCLLWALGFR